MRKGSKEKIAPAFKCRCKSLVPDECLVICDAYQHTNCNDICCLDDCKKYKLLMIDYRR